MEDRFVLDSPALEAAVTYRNSTGYPPRRPGRNSLDDPPAGGSSAYNGMFAVTKTEKGIYVARGYTDLGWFLGGHVRQGDPTTGYVCLAATITQISAPQFEARISTRPDDFYTPGECIFWELAIVEGDREITQLHQEGMIAFRERYFIS